MRFNPLTDHPPASVHLGILETTPAFRVGREGRARFAKVRLVPDDREIQVRMAAPGRGLLAEPQEGDEVIVFVPGNRSESEVALAVLANGAALQSQALDPAKLVLGVGKTGVELRIDDATPVQGVVLADFLAGLNDFVGALQVFFTSTAGAATAPVIATAAVTLQADPAYVNFLSQLSASVSNDTPYASANVKAAP